MEELAQLSNASASFDEIAAMGEPENPLDFPDPTVGQGIRVTANVYNPNSGEEASVSNVVYQVSESVQPMHTTRAYWIGRKLKKAIYGCVRSCTILRPRLKNGEYSLDSWEVTSEMGAVKIIDWKLVSMNKGRHTEDPIKEVAAIQFASRGGEHTNVMKSLDVLADDQYLYVFMPFCSSGELFGFVEREGRFSEPVARFWFRQILSVSIVSNFFKQTIRSHIYLNFLYILGIIPYAENGYMPSRFIFGKSACKSRERLCDHRSWYVFESTICSR